MKRLLFSTTILTMALSGFAQGTIEFQNTGGTPLLFSFRGVPTTNRVPSGNINEFGETSGPLVVGLLWGTSATSVDNLAGIEYIGTTPGVLAGNPNFPVAGTNPGDTDWFELIAWDSDYGTTLAGEQAALAAGGLWASANGTPFDPGPPLPFKLGPTPAPGTVIFGNSGTNSTGLFPRFYVDLDVPEPSTIGLGCMGAAALLLFPCKTRVKAVQ